MTSIYRKALTTSALTTVAGLASLLVASPAIAACPNGTTVNANDSKICVVDVTTTDTTGLADTDRNSPFSAATVPTYFTVNTGVTVDGFGAAWSQSDAGTNLTTVTNNGTIQIDAGNTATAGGPAALSINSNNASVLYQGTGNVINLGTVGDGLTITGAGTGALTANVGGSVTSAVGGNGITLRNTGTGGALSVTTAAGQTIRAGSVGVLAENTNIANSGNVTVANNATVASLVGAPNTLFVGVAGTTAGTGNINVSNTGTIGSLTDRAQFFALYGAHSGTAGSTTVTNGAGSIFGVNGILAQSISTGPITVATGSGAVNAIDTGILVNAGGTTNVTTVTTGTGAVTASAPTGVGINVVGLTNTAATTVTTGGTVTGGAFGIQAATLGTQTITANGLTSGGTAGIHSNTTAARTINVGTAGNVTGTTQAILIGNTGTAAINNSGVIGAASTGLAVQATGAGATTVTNNASGTLNGRLALTANADTLTNAGTFNTQGATDFGAGADVLNNTSTGVINILGATSFTNLETFTQNGRINLNNNILTLSAIPFTNNGFIDTSGNASIIGVTSFNNAGTLDLAPGVFTVPAVVFTNTGTILADEGISSITGQTSFANSGTIDLQDGVVNDVLTINSNFVGSGASSLLVDFNATTSDRLVVNGAASGTTAIGAAYLGGGFNLDGVLVADTVSSSANAFVLGSVTGETPLLDVSLVQSGADYFLVTAPTAAAFNPLVVPGFAADLWYQSANEVFAETVKPATTVGFSFWGEGYASRDKYGDDDGVVVDGVAFDVDNGMKTKRYGLQGGIDYGFDGARIGLTGGYGWAKANGNADADLKAKGWNLGVYGQFGGMTGFHGEFLLKHDRYDGKFTNGAFDGAEFDIRSTGVDGSLGYRFGLGGDATVDVHGGLSHVKTKIDDISAFGFDYDIGKVTSTRGRAGVRAILGGSLAPYIDATVYREFNGKGEVALFDGGNTYSLDTNNRGTWVRLEAGLSGNDGPGPILAAWGDLGDRKGLGLRAGWRFGGGQVAEALPPPPVIAPPPPPPPPATQTCADGSVILATDMCPSPPPPPPPPPMPERG